RWSVHCRTQHVLELRRIHDRDHSPILTPRRTSAMCVVLSSGVIEICVSETSRMLPFRRYCARPPATYCTPRSIDTTALLVLTGRKTPPPATHVDVQSD